MPTLFNTEGYKFKKPSIIELVLYNMAALLGGVAAGYDLRVSNVSPLHPTLQPYTSEVEWEPVGPPIYGVGHNTYHGPTRHLRASLNAITAAPIPSLQAEEPKPVLFTESPSHYAHPSSSSGYGHSAQPLSGTSGLGTNYTSTQPTPSPRRTSSTTSDHLGDLYHNYRENFQPNSNQHRDYFYRQEATYTFDRTADYVGKHPPYYGYDECSYDYREPSTNYPTHRRTPSNSSATNSHHDEFSPTRQFRTEKFPNKPREEFRSPKTEAFPRKSIDYSLPRDFFRQESQTSEVERPANLGLELAPTKLRSSLKKYNKKTSASGGSSSGGGTPTNPTPPDSLTSETDSYLSARDASSGSQSRVRFSPETMEGFLNLERRPSRHT